jgi:hypothetical protein
MFTISRDNSIVVLNRGDTFKCPLFINTGSELEPLRYTLTNTDILAFNILYPGTGEYLDENKDGFIENTPVLQHIYSNDGAAEHIPYILNSNGDIVISFTSDDFKKVSPGTYYYEVKLKYIDGGETRIDTIVPRTKFILVE